MNHCRVCEGPVDRKGGRCRGCYFSYQIGRSKTKELAVLDRFCKYFIKTNSCWEWIGYKDRKGYGKFRISTKSSDHLDIAPRVSYGLFKGQIPKGMCVLHSCDNPSCVRPDHLWLGTKRDNYWDMRKKGRAKNMYGAYR